MGASTVTSASVGPVVPTTVGGGGGGSTPPTSGGGGTSGPPVPPPVAPPGGPRFFQSPKWRTIITDMDGRLITLMDRRMFNRSASFLLNDACSFSGSCASDDPRVSRVWTPDGKGDPAVAEGTRFLHCFRKEDPTGEIPWTIRFSGLIMQVTDRTDSDRPVTDIVAFDPWQYLMQFPVVYETGEALNSDGIRFVGPDGNSPVPGSQIAIQILYNAIFSTPFFVDMIDWTSVFWGGTIENTAPITNWTISQGTTIGQAWKDLVATGTMDIVLTPIYDPINRPGTLCELSIFAQAGHNRWKAVFGWDKFKRSLTEVTRLEDGTTRANIQQWYAGEGGLPAGIQPPSLTSASLTKYGAYWKQQFETSNPIKTSVLRMAEAALAREQNGQVTYTLQPAPERGPFPFTEWFLGDCIFPYASDRLRQTIDGDTGPIVMSNVAAAGAGYAIGDEGQVTGGTLDAFYQVDDIDGSGGVAVYHLISNGTTYTNSEAVATFATTGTGAGFTINIGCGQRVYGFAVDINDEGEETITPALVAPS